MPHEAVNQTLRRTYRRELASLTKQLEAYPDEHMIWAQPPGILNSAGTLALHLCGNLQAFIGAQLGGTGYVRDRDGEFSHRDLPRAELIEEIERTAAAVDAALAGLTEARLAEDHPQEFMKGRLSTQTFLLHLGLHLAYHVGQIDYHRRMVTGEAAVVESLGIPGLFD